ncbi:hypothetical protein [Actinoalloteichus hymeniacidonis]|uniref:Uncharacterized protein n=1 Tax=Actinoalloteichus hymeniacidonis TaxID=340345 RepID=A0AAC9MZN0_9PSEU|nr:hypothetical protein [Actinoalloteichus hymeniacidonis]AOS64545.1 hypothetical protein TL08_18770 [Actinoalloteichus hymeniacidonis]MBB5907383.1 hypothetical protein [Actinoalloteichus hymeniacidonis]
MPRETRRRPPLDRELLDHSPRLTDTGALWRTKGRRFPRILGDFALLHLDDVLSLQDDRSTHPAYSTAHQHEFLS